MSISVLSRILKGTFKPSLVLIGQVVSEEMTFARNYIKSSKKPSKKGNSSNMA